MNRMTKAARLEAKIFERLSKLPTTVLRAMQAQCEWYAERDAREIASGCGEAWQADSIGDDLRQAERISNIIDERDEEARRERERVYNEREEKKCAKTKQLGRVAGRWGVSVTAKMRRAVRK